MQATPVSLEDFTCYLKKHVREAEEVHPSFRNLECVSCEYADLVKAFESGSEREIQRQCIHLAVTACRWWCLLEDKRKRTEAVKVNVKI